MQIFSYNWAVLAAAVAAASTLANDSGTMDHNVSQANTPATVRPPSFQVDIAPVLGAKCLNCHGETKRRCGFDIRSRELILKGGDSGPSIQGRDLQKSLLWQVIADTGHSGWVRKWPVKLSDAERQLIKEWIIVGAPE